ncbi:isopentenyl-diphosphate Delta-isomerase [Wenzhouxiangella sp. AB-CW3]|uniref:isopentenyl-diphosphate Delta-isomerase n=1 Tax=Wenzhouxiangella sp. AB-CW3 TaxID=2771012 RepID=UPI001CC2CECE|nr:isopentenyl-diphosphate Delta-isomerase [Wenzhouxiangella sp. AB-CW3]
MARLDQAGPARIVSSDSEELILVDEHDRELGTLSKGDCHDGDGVLHRAFSVFLFDPQGRLLIQQRAADKRLWPLYWANSCCSHPRAGEHMDEATRRRVEEELGVAAELEFVYKFQYHARYGELGSEHELCWVYTGRTTVSEVRPNPAEIADWKFLSPVDVDELVADEQAPVAPWFRMEWRELRERHWERIARLTDAGR